MIKLKAKDVYEIMEQNSYSLDARGWSKGLNKWEKDEWRKIAEEICKVVTIVIRERPR